MVRLMRLMTGGTVTVLVMLSAAGLGQAGSVTGAQAAVVRAALAPGSINNIMVIDLENENGAAARSGLVRRRPTSTTRSCPRASCCRTTTPRAT